MTSPSPHSQAARFRRIAPYAMVSGALFSLVAAAVAVFGTLDLFRSIEQLPKRFVYSAVMSLSFSVALGIAAYFSFRAWAKLRHVSGGTGDQSFEEAFEAVLQFLQAFYVWLVIFALVIIVAIALPVY